MKNEKNAGLSSLVLKIVRAAGEAGVEMITNLVNQIVVEKAITAEWEFSTILSSYKAKWTGPILKIVEKAIEKLMKEQVDIRRCSLVSYQDVKLEKPFLFWRIYRINMQQKRKMCIFIYRFRESFWLST